MNAPPAGVRQPVCWGLCVCLEGRPLSKGEALPVVTGAGGPASAQQSVGARGTEDGERRARLPVGAPRGGSPPWGRGLEGTRDWVGLVTLRVLDHV